MLHPSAVNSTTPIRGVLTSYAPQPFMFTMEKGELAEPKTPPPRPPGTQEEEIAEHLPTTDQH